MKIKQKKGEYDKKKTKRVNMKKIWGKKNLIKGGEGSL